MERRLADDRLAFDAIIRKRQVLIGYAPDWSRRRAENLLENVLVPRAKLGESWWEELQRTAPSGLSTDGGEITFAEAASEYVNRIQSQYENPSTLNAYLSPVLKHVGPFFAYAGEQPRIVSAINGTLVSAFTKAKMQEREILADLADTLAEFDDDVLRDAEALRAQLDSDHEWDVLVRYGQRGGRVPLAQALADGRGRISLSSRGLSNNEINRCLARLRDILDLAREEFGVDVGDPTRKRSLPRVEPARSWLRPFHLQAVFDAADELDARAPSHGGADYRLLGRRPLVMLLGLAGPRVSEVGSASWGHAHLGGTSPYLHIPEAKTSAGQRDLRLHPVVRDALADRKAKINPRSTDPVFATATGARRDRNSIRNRLLNPVLSRAGDLLTERGLPPLPDRVTPHTFRRTYLTYLAWAGVPIRRAMSQAGHKDAKLTLQIYQQDFPDDPPALAQVKAWLGIAD